MVRSVLNLVFKEVRGLHQAAYILALFAIGSQLLAIVRDRLFAHVFGAGSELDLYYAAFRIPDLLFVLFASILSIYVLLPFVNKRAAVEDERAGARVLSQVFTLFLVCFSFFAGVLAMLAPWYVPVLFPGFEGQYETLVVLLRILLLQAFLLGLSNLCGVVTQAGHRFVLFAISPLLYNLGIIFGVISLYPLFGLSGLVWGVVLGAVAHLVVQIPFVRQSPFRFSLTRTFNWHLVARICKIAIPRGLTLSINQLLLLVFIGMATTMAAGSVAVFQFAFNLQSVPLAIIGMSYSVAAFPALSRLLAEEKQEEFNAQLLTALRHIVFWSVPILFLIVVLRAQIVRVLLGSGAFDWADTRLTAAVLAVFVLSLVAQAVLLLLIRALYAGGRTFIPLVVVGFSGLLSIMLVLLLREIYATYPAVELFVTSLFRLENVVGAEVILLAAGYASSQLLQLGFLLLVTRSVFSLRFTPLVRLVVQSFAAAAMGGLVSYGTLNFVVDGINQNTFIGIGLQGLVAGLAGVLAVVATYFILRTPELNEIQQSFKTKLFKTDVVAPEPDRMT